MDELLAQLVQSNLSLAQGQSKTEQQVTILAQGQQNFQQNLVKSEHQLDQISRGMNERPQGARPSQLEQNLGHKQLEHVNATLSSNQVSLLTSLFLNWILMNFINI